MNVKKAMVEQNRRFDHGLFVENVLITTKCTKAGTIFYNLVIKANNTNVRRKIKLWQAITENRTLSSRDGPTNRVPASS